MSRLIEAIERGEIPEIIPVLDVIETQSAKVFLTDERAYKIYKRENHYFGDFGNEEYWRTFLRDDMHWNMTLAPEVYLEFRGLSYTGSWVMRDMATADDVLIVMQKLTSPNLTERLRTESISIELLCDAVRTMTKRVDILAPYVGTHRYPWRKNGWQSIFRTLVEGIYSWVPNADPYVPTEWSTHVVNRLIDAIDRSSYLHEFPEDQLAASVDCHSDNVFFDASGPLFLDSMLPKEGWRLVDPFCNTAKFAVDVCAYNDERVREQLYAAYAEQHPLPPEDVQAIYEVCYALLKCIYVALLGPLDVVPRYRALVEKGLEKLT